MSDSIARTVPLLAGLVVAVALSAPVALAEEDEPDYPHGEFEDDCEKCHTAESWTPARVGPEFDHAELGFPLTGSHASTACRACHETLEFSRAEADCVSCHLDVHQAELGSDCGRCHSPRSFIDRSGMVRAHLATRFPLRGVHRITDCEDCHPPVAQGSMQYVNTPVDCNACHADAWLGTTDPDHQAAGFPQTCEVCHAAHGWVPAGFDHSRLAAGAACASCHLDDYVAATDPDHQAAGYPQTCEICHSTRRWVPAAFDGLNHDGQWFPIYSGKHRRKWSRCSECHVVPNNFAQFSCLECHEHRQNEMDDKHSEVAGYQYDSQACLTCHPSGDE